MKKIFIVTIIVFLSLTIMYSQELPDKIQANAPIIGSFGTWEIVDKKSGPTVNYLNLSTPDGKNIMALGSAGIGVIRKSNDGGKTWNTVFTETPMQLHELKDIAYPTPNLAIAVGDSGTILRTTDGGISWDRQKTGYPSPLQFVEMLDSLNGLIGRLPDFSLLRTSNGGYSWDTLRLPKDLLPTLAGLTFLGYPEKDVIIFPLYWSDANYLLRTIDNTTTWEKFENLPYVVDAVVLNKDTIFATGNQSVNPSDKNDERKYDQILYSNNGGKNWDYVLNGEYYNPYSFGVQRVSFYDKNKGVAVGNGGKLYFTTNTGSTWYLDTTVTSNIDRSHYFFKCATFSEKNKIIIGTGQGDILRFTLTSIIDVEENNHNNKNNLSISPNPAKDFLNINIIQEFPYPTNIKIFNIHGQIVFTDEIPSGIKNFNIKIEKLPSGMYFINAVNGQSTETQKFVLIK